jgi:hypothetical protein
VEFWPAKVRCSFSPDGPRLSQVCEDSGRLTVSAKPHSRERPSGWTFDRLSAGPLRVCPKEPFSLRNWTVVSNTGGSRVSPRESAQQAATSSTKSRQRGCRRKAKSRERTILRSAAQRGRAFFEFLLESWRQKMAIPPADSHCLNPSAVISDVSFSVWITDWYSARCSAVLLGSALLLYLSHALVATW